MIRSIETRGVGKYCRPARPSQDIDCLQDYGTSEEVAQLALFLVSDDASYCTGGIRMIDGGFTAA